MFEREDTICYIDDFLIYGTDGRIDGIYEDKDISHMLLYAIYDSTLMGLYLLPTAQSYILIAS